MTSYENLEENQEIKSKQSMLQLRELTHGNATIFFR
jgi:hypothetical protein